MTTPPRRPGTSRRAVLKAGALSGAALFTTGWASLGATPPATALAGGAAAVPSLARIAAVDDAVRLWLYSFDSPAWVVGRVLNRIDIARVAAILPATAAEVADLLEGARATYAAEVADPSQKAVAPPQTAERVAFGLGWLAHHAAEGPLGGPAGDDARLARDAAVLQSYMFDGAAPPDADSVESLYDVMWHRALVRLHTLKTDESDVEAWIHRFMGFVEADEDRRAQIAAAAGGAGAGTDFLDPADPVIATTRRLRVGAVREPVPVLALLDAPGASRYARAVAEATRALLSGAQYITGGVTAPTLVGRFREGD